MREPRFDRAVAPLQIQLGLPRAALDRRGELHHPLGRVGAPIEDDVLDMLEQLARDVFVDDQLPRVDDAHVEARLDRVIQEGRVDCLADDVVAAKRKRQVADAAADLHARTGRLDDSRRLDEIDRVRVVLLEASPDREDVRIEDDVGGLEAGALGEQFVRALTDRDLAIDRVGLSSFVERHHDDACAIAADELGLLQKIVLAFFEADRVDDRLALDAFEAGEDDGPLRAVDHDRQPRDFRLGGDVVQELGHRPLRIQHPFVHVHVDQVRAAAHLIERHARRVPVTAGPNEPRESRRAGDVGPLADHLEVRIGANGQRFETGELSETLHHGGHGGRGRILYVLISVSPVSSVVERFHPPRRHARDRFRDRRDVLRCRAAAAADDVHEAARGEFTEVRIDRAEKHDLHGRLA